LLTGYLNFVTGRRLLTCVIYPYPGGSHSEAHQDVESWIQYAVSCKVSVLRIRSPYGEHSHLQLSNRSVISEHLTVLELYRLEFEEHPLNLLSCRALEVLEIDDCVINFWDSFPKSLRRLTIINATLFSMHAPRARISAPGLLTFELSNCFEWSPLIESLPSLVTAYIRIDCNSEDSCYQKYLGDCCNETCNGCSVKDDCSVLLEGLSEAMSLELLSERSMVRLLFS
jgi:hypothetical protein